MLLAMLGSKTFFEHDSRQLSESHAKEILRKSDLAK